MKNIMAKLFLTATATAKPGSGNSVPASSPKPTAIQEGSENSARRQLIQLLLHDLLANNGIPSAWIRCEMLMVSSRSRGTGLHARLIVSQWDDRLMHYVYAVQNRFLSDIEKFDPAFSRWLHGVSWEFEVSESCLRTELPPKEFWTDNATLLTKPSASATLSSRSVNQKDAGSESTAAEQMDDVEKLLAIRDRELGRRAAQGMTPVGYEKTQPSPL